MDEPSNKTIVNLKLTNNNEFVISDRHDGVPYEFAPGVAQSIPSDAALHMLGWYPGVDMMVVRQHVQKRWGWNTPELVKDKKHDEYFGKLAFKPVTYRIVEVPAEEIEMPDDKPTKNGKAKGLEASA
jgi:hypothetical protein